MDRYKVVKSSRSQVDPATGHLLRDDAQPPAAGDGGSGGGSSYTLPAATASRLGGVKVGRNLVMEGTTLSAVVPLPYDDSDLRGVVSDHSAAIEDLRDAVESDGGTTVIPYELPAASAAVRGGVRVNAKSNAYMIDDILYVEDMRYNDIELYNAVVQKQERLIDGWNVKTVNGQSILGAGNIEVASSSGGGGAEVRRKLTLTDGFTSVDWRYGVSVGIRTDSGTPIANWDYEAVRIVETLDRVTLHLVFEISQDVEENKLAEMVRSFYYTPATLIPNRTIPIAVGSVDNVWGTLTLNQMHSPGYLQATGQNYYLARGTRVFMTALFDKIEPEWMDPAPFPMPEMPGGEVPEDGTPGGTPTPPADWIDYDGHVISGSHGFWDSHAKWTFYDAPNQDPHYWDDGGISHDPLKGGYYRVDGIWIPPQENDGPPTSGPIPNYPMPGT